MIYDTRPNLMLGFHGCDEAVRDQVVLNPNAVRKSAATWDWLGHGFYLWENNYERALKWAKDKKQRREIEKPSVVGVVYQLEHCLDFTDSTFIDRLAEYFSLMKFDFLTRDRVLPTNKNHPKDENKDLILRALDCAVIEYLHQDMAEKIALETAQKGFSNIRHFDTTRGVFTEGGPAFEGAGIQTKNHIQICIRNLNCIKGFFVPRNHVHFP